ncbi:MAG TPA: C2 family cysteine protease, partial [Tepidisphaeraceae bacterium]
TGGIGSTGALDGNTLDGGGNSSRVTTGFPIITSMTPLNGGIVARASDGRVFYSPNGLQLESSLVQASTEIYGGTGNDTLTGGAGGDSIRGGSGNDLIRGNGGNDLLYGDDGNDTLYGGGGNNSLYGGSGNDTLVAVGGGRDVVTAGSGSDSIWVDHEIVYSTVGSLTVSTTFDSVRDATSADDVHWIDQFEGGVSKAAGDSLPDPSDSGTTVKVNLPLWGAAPVAGDVNQGGTGDCYFMAMLAALAGTDPSTLQNSAVDLGDGTFVVQFYQGDSPKFIRVSNKLPGWGRGAYPGINNTIWAPIMEKALCYFRAGDNTYESIGVGGPLWEPYDDFGIKNTNFTPADYSETELSDMLSNGLSSGNAITLGTKLPPDLIASHAYTLISVSHDSSGAARFVVRNPWGLKGDSLENSQGYATLTYSEFTSNFYWGCMATGGGAGTGGGVGQGPPVLPLLDTITGTSGIDQILIIRDPDQIHLDWTNGTDSGQLLIDDPAGLTINGNGGNDTITLVNTNGNALPNMLHLNGTFTVNGLSNTNPFAGTTLELGQSTVFINYANAGADAATKALIKTYLANGFNGGAWTGVPTASTGVITSTAARNNVNHNTGIGWADSSDGTGVNTTPNTIELKYTLNGDATLNGVVDIFDLNALLPHFNSTGDWTGGDSNYTGTVDIFDLNALLPNFNTNLGAQATPAMASVAPASAAASTVNNSSSTSSNMTVTSVTPFKVSGSESTSSSNINIAAVNSTSSPIDSNLIPKKQTKKKHK